MMMIVVIAAIPCVLMAMWNTGYQANLGLDPAKLADLPGWRHAVIRALGIGYSPDSLVANVVHGALYFLPVYIVTMVVGLSWEVGFAIVRKLEVNEGFFVTGILFALIVPPTIPLWQVAVGISFGVIFAKELFGGTGMNFVNPALAARAFLFFSYPAFMSGDQVWTAALPGFTVDGYLGRDAARPVAPGHRAVLGAVVRLLARVRRHRAGIDGRDLGAGLPDRRGDPDRHRRGLVADDGRRGARAPSAWRRCSTPSAPRRTPTSPSRSGGTWWPAAGPSRPCSWPPTR